MNRERWTSLPATTVGERALLDSLDGARLVREVAVAAPDGCARVIGTAFSIEVAEPFDGKADVVVRLALDRDALREGEAVLADPWALLDAVLADALREAVRQASPGR